MNKNSINGFSQYHQHVGEDHHHNHIINAQLYNFISSTINYSRLRANFQFPKFTHLVLTLSNHIPTSQFNHCQHKHYLIAPRKLAPSSLAPSKCWVISSKSKRVSNYIFKIICLKQHRHHQLLAVAVQPNTTQTVPTPIHINGHQNFQNSNIGTITSELNNMKNIEYLIYNSINSNDMFTKKKDI